ncbi:hypothetical protein J5N97_026290 [Dioscorea zingiberensis]|uniref:Uncharacterized protein n=1 Tax=Dioscorea zingiberensis TaxID=325984 RepID=A0A9D5C1V2_9LILI|nr:hypothetical protein J5N97_026290 [Dioscorea zingiberensis]
MLMLHLVIESFLSGSRRRPDCVRHRRRWLHRAQEVPPGFPSSLIHLKSPPTTLSRPVPGGFNDAATANVLLCLEIEDSSSYSMDLHLYSFALRRCRYFATLLSDHWLLDSPSSARLTLKLPYISTPNLLYTLDFPSSLLSV